MKLTIIDDLKKAKPKRRAEILQKIHEKNLVFFKRRSPHLGDALENLGTGNFEIRLNNDFLDIIERRSGQYAHPPGKLIEYIEKISSWHHTGWIDKLEVVHRYTGNHEHGELLHAFLEAVYKNIPQISERMRSGNIQLPKMKDGRRFSGSTVFLGALTGLHIVHYLNTTEVRDVFIIEPDILKFALSCWFVDYSAIEQRFNRLVLHVGEDMPESPLDYLLGASPIVAGVWLRMLPIYASSYFDTVIARTNLRWRALHEILVPFDREVRNLGYGAANLRARRPVLYKKPILSKNSRIAVVASGPSLENDIPWLKANRNKLILFAVHSSVRVLRKHGIVPDFQCTLDTELTDDLPKLALDPDIPFVVYYKADPEALRNFKTVLLVPENGKANVVKFRKPITYTHPTSGNLAVAVSLFMQPSTIFLLGLDLGFRSAEKSHATGTWHDDAEGAGHEDAQWRDRVVAVANFDDIQEDVYTHAYYNQSRFAVQNAIASQTGVSSVLNFSDGVRINGAEPQRSSNHSTLSAYPGRKKDIQAIISAFSDNADEVFEPYGTSGSLMLSHLCEDLYEALNLEYPAWVNFAESLDSAWSRVVQKRLQADPEDLRVEAYGKFIQDILADWLRVMIFTQTPSEFITAYKAGLEQLQAVLARLKWPENLDF